MSTRTATPRRVRAVPPPPIGGLLDRRFVYTPSAATDIRKTFERVRAEQSKGKR